MKQKVLYILLNLVCTAVMVVIFSSLAGSQADQLHYHISAFVIPMSILYLPALFFGYGAAYRGGGRKFSNFTAMTSSGLVSGTIDHGVAEPDKDTPPAPPGTRSKAFVGVFISIVLIYLLFTFIINNISILFNLLSVAFFMSLLMFVPYLDVVVSLILTAVIAFFSIKYLIKVLKRSLKLAYVLFAILISGLQAWLLLILVYGFPEYWRILQVLYDVFV